MYTYVNYMYTYVYYIVDYLVICEALHEIKDLVHQMLSVCAVCTFRLTHELSKNFKWSKKF